MRKILLSIIIVVCYYSVFATDKWKVYNAVPDIQQIQFFGDRVFALYGNSLVSFSTDSLDIDYYQYDKIDGLSGYQIKFLARSKAAECLSIIYEDGNIDVLHADGSISNIPDLANKSMAGDKTIYNVRESAGYLYLAGGFGFIEVDLKQGTIPISCTTPYPVKYAFATKEFYYRYSETKNLEYCSRNANVSNNSSWHAGNPVTINDIQVFTDTTGTVHCWLIDNEGTLKQLLTPTQIDNISTHKYQKIHPLYGKVILQGADFIDLADPLQRTFTRNADSPVPSCIGFAADNTEKVIYMAHPNSNIYRMEISKYVPEESLKFTMDLKHPLHASGITTMYIGDMQLSKEGELVAISRRSYITGMQAAHSLSGRISRYNFDEDEWTTINAVDNIISHLTYRKAFQGLTGLSIDPINENRYAISTALHGLYIIDHDTLLYRYDDLNSNGSVEAFSKDYSSTRVSSVAYDDNGNLFYANSVQDTILRCITPEGKCIKYPNNGFMQLSDANRILISQHDGYQLKWVLNDYGYENSRIGIYYDKGNPGIVGTSQYQTAWFSTLVDQDQNKYVPSYINDICEDLTGNIWVLTTIGPFVIDNTKTTFEYAQKNPGQGKVTRIKIPRNDGSNLADYLLATTACTCMAVDNLNRKWIGTRESGLYQMSADGITTIEHFTSENSPLISDNILALRFDPVTGKLFISCQGGVITYQTDTDEEESDFGNIHCFPNPVRPDYFGDLLIEGLMNDSFVTITTVTGDPIFRTQSLGSTVSWNMQTTEGKRINPGIYLIHGIDSNGNKGKVCKFLVL